MTVLEDLTEDECYLWAILSDPSGIDQAEWAWADPTAVDTDEIYRAWPFQWKWYHCTDRLQIDQCGRALGKTHSIKLRAFAFPFLWPNSEFLLTTPTLIHMKPLTRIIEKQILDVRLTREMLIKGRNAITHNLFEVDFQNGARIVGRIPHTDGSAVKGAHPLWLELDEASEYPEAGWIELVETLNRAYEGAIWRCHGVTKGLRDYFYKLTQPDSGWTVHRWTGMHRPTWNDEERAEKIEMYGSKDNPDYRRNVLGLHGDATNPLFVLHRLMQAADTNEASDYNTLEYKYIRINAERLIDVGGAIELPLGELPRIRHADDQGYWLGADIGFTNHPTEVLAFVERGKGAQAVLQLMARIHMERIRHEDQAKAFLWLLEYYQATAFSMDKTGLGLPLFQDIQDRAPHLAERIKGYNFSSKIIVEFDKTVKLDPNFPNPEDAAIEKNVLEHSSDVLRGLVDAERLRLPWDKELIREFQGQTYTIDRSGMDLYGRKRIFSKGSFHALDAARMAVLGWSQQPIEEKLNHDNRGNVLDVFVW